ncbi:MAG: NUDIX domain-containing protein [archaeon]|nr:NUDIX domain-containing protein [archaeon]MCR4323662.1 NUDIX domain-containing protein [Nanoarchaeota archaeon]
MAEGKYIVASGPVIVEDGKLLVAKDTKDDFYKLPGGTVKEGESLEAGCKRRAREEVNAEVEIIRPLLPNILYENPTTKEKMTIILINYESKLLNKDELKPLPPTTDLKWVSIEDIKNGLGNVSPNVREMVEKNF